YKGAAAAARDTFGGALTGLKNALGDLLEGKSSLPKTTEEINRLTDALSRDETKEGVDSLISGVAAVLRAGGTVIGDIVRETKLIPELMSDSFRDTFFLTTELEKLERQLRDIDRFTKSGALGRIPILGAYSPEELRS